MNHFLTRIFALLLMLFSGTLLAQEAELTLLPAEEENPWLGEQVTLNLDLKTNGVIFEGVQFTLPGVDQAFLLQTSSSTTKLTERRGQETWQVLRYPLAFFPQGSGTLSIPSMEVRFGVSNGFGQTVKNFTLTTAPLTIDVNRPPGIPEGTLVVTSPDYALRQEWSSEAETLKPGDALTLEVRREVESISAMLLPPLPVFETDGLAVYPASPELEDRANRGNLVGYRTDRITWIVEQAGDYEIPPVRFRWWNPEREQLQEIIVEGRSFKVPAPAGGAGRPAIKAAPAPTQDWLQQLVFLALLLTALVTAVWYFRTPLRKAWRKLLPKKTTLPPALNPGDWT